MSTETTVQTSDEPTEVRSLEDSLEKQLAKVLEKRTAATEAKFSAALEKLAAQPAQGEAERAGRVAGDDASREEKTSHTRTIVSMHQPTDALYRRLYRANPEAEECRTPEMDHWNHKWLLGLMTGREAVAVEAYDKANEAYRRQFKRETTLEGALDSSDPTAILDGTGGSLLPQPFSQVVMIAREAAAVIRSLSTVYPMSSATLRIPTAANATAKKLAEGGDASSSPDEPTYASIMMRAEKLVTYMKASREFINDSAFNAVGLFGTRAGMAIGAGEDVDFCTSNGTSPNCSAAIAGGNVDEATPTVLVYEDISTLYRAVPKAYRGAGCAWLANNVTLGLIDVLMDGNDRPILVNPTQTPTAVGDSPGNEGQIFRHPVYEVPLADGQLIFGNIRAGYAIGDRQGISARMSEHSSFSTGLVEFIFEERYDAQIQDAGAMKQMSGLASVA